MSELRQVDRVVLEALIDLSERVIYEDNATALKLRALLTEQPEPDAPQEVETFSDWEAICAGWKERAIAAEEQRDQYKEQRDTLARHVREYLYTMKCDSVDAVRRAREEMMRYAEEVGGSE